MKTAAFLRCLCLPVVLVACDRANEPAQTPTPAPWEAAQHPVVKEPPVATTQETPVTSIDTQPTPEPRPSTTVLPLARILEIVRRDTPGEVLEVEEDEDDDLPTYEVQILTPDDRKIEITLNAYTGAIIERDED